MPHIFITAFEPYDQWDENASWMALVDFTKNLPPQAKITTRRYPVDFQAVFERLRHDLREGFDYVLHLGQAPGSPEIRLESIGLNVGGNPSARSESHPMLVADGPVAYRSELPLAEWAQLLRAARIPASVSYHAGTYLCNATLYLSHHIAHQQQLPTKSAFMHVPLDPSQAAKQGEGIATMPATMSSAALQVIVGDLIKRERAGVPALA